MATMFDGLAGQRPWRPRPRGRAWLTSQLGGIARTVPPARAVTEPGNPTAARTSVETIRIRSIRRFTVASQHRGQPAKTQSPYAGPDSTGKSAPGPRVRQDPRRVGPRRTSEPGPITKPRCYSGKPPRPANSGAGASNQIGPFGAVSLDPAQHPPARADHRSRRPAPPGRPRCQAAVRRQGISYPRSSTRHTPSAISPGGSSNTTSRRLPSGFSTWKLKTLVSPSGDTSPLTFHVTTRGGRSRPISRRPRRPPLPSSHSKTQRAPWPI
jgi:hypothetical protein